MHGTGSAAGDGLAAANRDYPVTGGYIHLVAAGISPWEITFCDTSVTEAVIPSEIPELNNPSIASAITAIRWDAFRGCSKLTSVTIPGSVSVTVNGIPVVWTDAEPFIDANGRTIGRDAFGLTGMTTVTIPYSVASIGERAFEYNYVAEGGPVASMNFTIVGYTGSAAESYYKQMLMYGREADVSNFVR